MRSIIALLIVLSISFSACNGQISQYVPAVVGQNGGLVNVSVHLVPGNGNVYVNVYPRTGLMTQESLEDAVKYAYSLADLDKNCDVLVRFTSSAGYIEGPSAGTALTVMTYALLENRTMRQDTIITGTIDKGGNVGPVGGLYEKSKGAAERGAKYFITPVENFYEILLLKNVEREDGITILQARNVEEVIGFMIENQSIDQQGLIAKNREIPILQPYDVSELNAFVPVAQKIVDLEEEAVGSFQTTDNETGKIKEFFINEVERQNSLLDRGYVFSAANEAFLNYIDLSTIKVILSGNADLPRKKGEVGKCLSQISRPKITDINFEWVIGADLREAWAYDKLNDTEVSETQLIEEKYIKFNELMYGDAWCIVAKELIRDAPNGGDLVDENAWKTLAENKLAEARSVGTSGDETRSRLSIAESSYLKGRYGAAIYDAIYVTRMEKSAQELSGQLPKAENEIMSLLNENRTSLWGRVYQSQGAFLYKQNDTAGAYRILKFAKAIDNATDEMIARAQLIEGGTQIPQTAEPDNLLVTAILIALIFLLIVGIIILAWRSYGDNSTGTGKTYRTQQKKGRT